MRGYPPFQILLVLIFAVVLAWPLLHLTGQTGAQIHVLSSDVDLSAPTHTPRGVVITVRASAPPQSLKLLSGEKDLLAGQTVGGEPLQVEWKLPITKDGLEWHLQGEWPEGAPEAAVTVTVEPEGLDSRTETRWSSGALMDAFLVYLWPE